MMTLQPQVLSRGNTPRAFVSEWDGPPDFSLTHSEYWRVVNGVEFKKVWILLTPVLLDEPHSIAPWLVNS